MSTEILTKNESEKTKNAITQQEIPERQEIVRILLGIDDGGVIPKTMRDKVWESLAVDDIIKNIKNILTSKKYTWIEHIALDVLQYASKATINDVRMAFYERGLLQDQEIILPVPSKKITEKNPLLNT